jgi:archaellum component FlaG (FlaF/FlaG flagellin family)
MRTALNKLIYHIDNVISKGTFNIIVIIIITIMIFAGLFSIIVFLLGLNDNSIFSQIFSNFIFTSLKYKSSQSQYLIFEVINFLMFIVGLLLTAALIGAITTGISDKLKQLRNSSSFILEKQHVVILGFSSHIISIIKELIIANESEKNSCIVILGRKPREQMKQIINKEIKNFKNTKIIFREGDRCVKNDLIQLNLDESKAIIINQHSHQLSDVSKTLLAIINKPSRKKEPYHIVASVNNKEEAILCKLIGKDEVEIIESHDFLVRLESQTCRQSGLPLVYEELLNFVGDEIYFKKERSLIGKSFSKSANYFNTSVLIGLYRDNKVFLNPKSNTIIKDDDQIIGISEDDSTFLLDNLNPKTINEKKFSKLTKFSSKPEKFLFLGFNSFTEDVLILLGKYANKNSLCDIIIEGKGKNKIKKYNNLTLSYFYTTRINRSYLDDVNFKKYNFVVIQSSYDIKNSYEEDIVDNKTLSIILNLRDLKELNNYTFKIISELFDSNNHDLIQNSQIDDFILSEKFISSAIAQVSENKKLSLVFTELFKPKGSEIYLKPIENYINPKKELNFFEVSGSTIRKNEIAIGYRLKRFSNIPLTKFNGKELNYGVIINPTKSEIIIFEEGDDLIVLAEN